MTSRNWPALVGCAIFCASAPASAGEASVPLLQTGDLQAAASTGYQGATGDASGAIHYPDQILAYPIAETGDNKSLLDAWTKSHRFFVVPFELSLAPAPRQTPQRVDISMAFAGLGAMRSSRSSSTCFRKPGLLPGLSRRLERSSWEPI